MYETRTALLAAMTLVGTAALAQEPPAASATAGVAQTPTGPAIPTPAALWDAWPAARFVPTAAPCLRHAELVERLRALVARHPEALRLEEIGRSVEGRPVHLLTLGRGPRRILLWSQMHGDEPSATPALLDAVDFLLSHRDDPAASAILERLTLLVVPMLNPDGAERYQRRNAQAIDINRDALNLATPEGVLLKAVRDRYQPELGFNLHDQNRRTVVGDTGVLASIALLAVSGDPQGTLTPGRLRAKRVCSAVVRALCPFVPGGVSRYDEDWSPRAFGDNLTAWGTPVVLIESGGLPPGRPVTDLARLNFVALLTTLAGLAVDDLAGDDPALYDGLPRNDDGVYADVVLRGGMLLQPPLPAPYRADVAFGAARSDLEWAGCGLPRGTSRVVEVGDARFMGTGQSVDAAGALVMPALTVSARGPDVRAWLDATALEAMGALGVGTVRWHVAPRDLAAAEEHARTLAAAGRPLVTIVGDSDAPSPLVVPRAPGALEKATLGGALDALTGRGWRSGEPTTALARVLAAPWAGPAPASAPLTLDARASLMLLRPSRPGSLDPDLLGIERVWIDGRPAASALAPD